MIAIVEAIATLSQQIPRCAKAEVAAPMRTCELLGVSVTCAADGFGGCRTCPAVACWMRKPGLAVRRSLARTPWSLHRGLRAKESKKCGRGGGASKHPSLDLFTFDGCCGQCLSSLDGTAGKLAALSSREEAPVSLGFPTRSTSGAGFEFFLPNGLRKILRKTASVSLTVCRVGLCCAAQLMGACF